MRLYVCAIMYIFYISCAVVCRILHVMRGLILRLQLLEKFFLLFDREKQRYYKVVEE